MCWLNIFQRNSKLLFYISACDVNHLEAIFFATNTKQIWNQDVCLFPFSRAITHFFVVRAQVALMLPSKQHEVHPLLLIPSNIYTQELERRIWRNRKQSNRQLILEIHRKASRCPFDLCAPSLIFTTQCFF